MEWQFDDGSIFNGISNTGHETNGQNLNEP